MTRILVALLVAASFALGDALWVAVSGDGLPGRVWFGDCFGSFISVMIGWQAHAQIGLGTGTRRRSR
jgi:hypothetical protein